MSVKGQVGMLFLTQAYILSCEIQLLPDTSQNQGVVTVN